MARMTARRTFEELVEEGRSAPVAGWGFSWFEGRAAEERPSWGYLRRMSARMVTARSALDLQTGGGEVLSEVERPPPRLVATEGWPPNLPLAHANLTRLDGHVVQAPDGGPLPFRDGAFDLVVSRHPTVTPWIEIARVLCESGAFVSQQIGPGSLRELTEAMLGPQPQSDARSPERAAEQARRAGLDITELQQARLRTVFFDIGAVVAFLRKVVWIVPGFDVDDYESPLRAVHERIESDGHFTAHATRFLIEARKR
jgi:SAM-dependent methyltransferase